MKYIKYFLVVLTTLFVAVGEGYSQRNVILTHGFGDFNSAWNVYRPFLSTSLNTNRLNPVSVFRAGYSSFNVDRTTSVATAVQEVDNQLPFSNQSIVVGQSMGGIVLRDIDRQFPNRKFGGIITLGSPNRGGALLNALQNGTVQAELNDGCNHVGSATSSAILALSMIRPGLVAGFGFFLGGAIEVFKNTLCNDAINDLNRGLPTETAPNVVRDLSENSDVINTLNRSNTPAFKIGVFGVENSPVHMRLLSSLKEKNKPFNQPLGVDDTDIELVNLFNTVNDITAIGEAVFIVAAVTLSINAIWNWPLLFPAAICAWAAYEWGALRRWMNQSESKWHAIIGAGGFFEETVNVRFFNCNSALDNAYDLYDRRKITVAQLRLIEQRLNADPNCFINLPQTIRFPINNESDGMFNAGTQRIPTDPNNAQHVVNLPVEGVNHREFFNHPSMTQAFTAIFAGERGVNPFFRIN